MTAIPRISIEVLLAGLFLLPLQTQAQVTRSDYARALGLRDRFERLTVNVPEPATWIEKTDRFYYRKSVKGGHQFIIVHAGTLEKQPAFDHGRLAAALSKAGGETYSALLLPFTSFAFGDGERAIEMTIQGRSWTCTLTDYTCSKGEEELFGGRRGRGGPVRDSQARVDSTPKRSPDGKWEALVRNYNVAVRSAGADKMKLLTTDGSEGNFYELDSLAWSPDSTKIAVYRIKPGHRRVVQYVVSSPDDQVQPKHLTVLYPKPGDLVDVEQPVLLHIESGRQLSIPNDLFPNAYDMSDLVWRKDSRAVTFEYNQRGHRLYRVIEADAPTGRPRAIISEEPETFFNYRPATSDLRANGKRVRHDVNDGKEIIWMSERDGWSHLYLYDGATGGVINRITTGAWAVLGVEKVDDEKRQIWFAAGGMSPGQDPYFRHYYRVNFDGTGLTPLTQADAYHDVSFSSDRQYFVDTYSRVDLPPVSELRRTSDRSLVAELERGDITELVKAGWKAPEVFVAKGRDGRTDIWGIIVRPTTFDPKKKYPVIENIYAGPQGSFVPKTFAPYLAHQAQAEMGFIVAQIDGMGTANRSKAFHDVAWKNLGDAGFPDRILWHKAAAAKYPAYDISRVGIYGGSAGGQNALGGLLFHPEFYQVAVAYAGCHDNRMDKISWNELWMSWPVGPEYGASSNVDNAWRLQGKVLLVVGELDTNVDPASTFQVVNALTKANKTFDLTVIPGAGHSAGRSDEHGPYGLRKQFDFFVQHLLAMQPPNWNRPVLTSTENASRGR